MVKRNLTMSKLIEKNILVCLQNKCVKCGLRDSIVPKKCKFAILHCLETQKVDIGIKEKGRQSGKTTRLLELANRLKELGVPVYYVTRNSRMVEYIKHHTTNGNNTILLSFERLKHREEYFPPGYILTDELTPDEAEIMEMRMAGSRLLAGYYTFCE
jgi:hypothetical protein